MAGYWTDNHYTHHIDAVGDIIENVKGRSNFNLSLTVVGETVVGETDESKYARMVDYFNRHLFLHYEREITFESLVYRWNILKRSYMFDRITVPR